MMTLSRLLTNLVPQAILGGKLPVHLVTGPDAATISPQPVGFDFVSNIKFQTVTAVTNSLVYADGGTSPCNCVH